MSLNRTSLRLVAGVLILLIGLPALAQDLRGVQLFAPADLSTYGSGIQPKEGYFFVFDGLNWSISKPIVTTIGNDAPGERSRLVYNVGNPDTAWTQTNSHDTGPLRGSFTGGNRIEFGRVCDRRGWIFSTYRLNNQSQRFAASDVHVVFADDDDWGDPSGGRLEGAIIDDTDPPSDPPDFGVAGNPAPLPVIFDDVVVYNRVEHWSVELMCIQRMRPCHYGGIFEWFAGVRYLEFDDTFDVDARREDVATDNSHVILGNSIWSTEAQNHIVGPQVGLRWFNKNGRWMLSTEGRFLAGFNSQNIRQQGVLGSELNPDLAARVLGEPSMMLATDFNHVEHIQDWSPVFELRAEARYQLTRAVSFRAGWTGIWMDGIARASNMVDYSLYEEGVMGILTSQNRQDVFIHGLTIGVDVNR